eukprot:gene8137-10418_t
MDVYWGKLPVSLRSVLITSIFKRVYKLRGYSLSNILWGLGRMSARWRQDLSDTLKVRLLRRLEAISPMELHSIASSLSGLNKLGLTWYDLPVNLRGAIQQSIEMVMPTVDIERGLVKDVSSEEEGEGAGEGEGGGRLSPGKGNDVSPRSTSTSSPRPAINNNGESRYKPTGDNIKESLKAVAGGGGGTLVDTPPPSWKPREAEQSIGEHTASAVIYTMAKMGALYADLTPGCREGLVSSLRLVHQNFSHQGFSNSIYGFARMGARWGDFPPDVQQLISHTALRILPEMNDQCVSNLIWCISMFGFTYSSETKALVFRRPNGYVQSTPLIDELEDEAMVGEDSLAADSNEGVVRGEGGLGEHGQSSSTSIPSTSPPSPSSTSPRTWTAANRMKGRGGGGGQIASSPSLLRIFFQAVNRVAPSFSEQGLSQVLTGLGKLGVPWSTLPAETRRALVWALLRVRVSENSAWSVSNKLL